MGGSAMENQGNGEEENDINIPCYSLEWFTCTGPR